MLKPLPVGVSTFSDIINGGYLYVDKTKWIHELVRHPKGPYFLARPRRFGKSLLVSTLEEVFGGNRALFKGLYIDSTDYQWENYPVIRIDFSQERVNNADELQLVISDYLNDMANEIGITLPQTRVFRQFRLLIRKMAANGKVVILVDEYDKPIIDNITNVKEAQRIRDVLKGFYTIIKAMDQYVRFVFLTGISKFSKACPDEGRISVFSGLNNLNDMSMDERYAAILGITEEEMQHYFADYINLLASREDITQQQLKKRIKTWYNGFRFSKLEQPLYNPFSMLLLFDKQDFRNYWFESGTPTFLIDLIRKEQYDIEKIEGLKVSELAFSSYEIENLKVLPLLFQTGYLTIKGYEEKESLSSKGQTRRLYDLYYPNYEVESAFLEYLVGTFTDVQNGASEAHLWALVEALENQDLDGFFEILSIFFANIPYDLHLKYEKYYQTIFYLIFKLIGLIVEAEVKTNPSAGSGHRQGRIDTVIILSDTVFIFEFKLDGTAEEALQQIKTTQYYQKYRQSKKEIYLIGVNFDSNKRSIGEWTVSKTLSANQA